MEQTRETKRDCEIVLRKTLARLQKYERAFDAADTKIESYEIEYKLYAKISRE